MLPMEYPLSIKQGLSFLMLECAGLHCLYSLGSLAYEPHHEKTDVLVSNKVQHKPGCTASKDD